MRHQSVSARNFRISAHSRLISGLVLRIPLRLFFCLNCLGYRFVADLHRFLSFHEALSDRSR
jgi:hypothetical protein